MKSLIVIFFLVGSLRGLFHCDFESVCDDLILDEYWGLTDGAHPILIDHDHTINTSAGHYIFYQPESDEQTQFSEIKVRDWIEPSSNTTMCFNMWYFTTNLNFTFTIQLVQGDDERLSRVLEEVSYVNHSIDDWTEVKLVLPNERKKLAIRLNSTSEHLVFDDLSVDSCDMPAPPVPKVILACDFESSCSDSFLSLPFYPYQWQVIQAGQPPEMASFPPRYDFTYGNTSGHYAWVNNERRSRTGRVGYYATQKSFYIQPDQSYCLSFEYFQYMLKNGTKLKVYAWIADSSGAIQLLWPLSDANDYV